MPTPLKIIIHAHTFREIVALHSLTGKDKSNCKLYTLQSYTTPDVKSRMYMESFFFTPVQMLSAAF